MDGRKSSGSSNHSSFSADETESAFDDVGGSDEVDKKFDNGNDDDDPAIAPAVAPPLVLVLYVLLLSQYSPVFAVVSPSVIICKFRPVLIPVVAAMMAALLSNTTIRMNHWYV